MQESTLFIVCEALASACAIWLVLPRQDRFRAVVPTRTSLLLRIGMLRRIAEAQELSVKRTECLSEIPELLDIVTLGLSAGLSFDVALSLYCDEYSGALADELSQAKLSWRVGIVSRAEALEGMAERLDLAALRRFAAAVTEAISFGAPLAEVLERQAQSVRDEQRAKVEEQIEKAPVKMLIPLGTLIVPAMMLSILGPLLAAATGIG